MTVEDNSFKILPKTLDREAITHLLQHDFTLSHSNVEVFRSAAVQENWTVRYEEYFNPHASPKSLFASERFLNAEDAVDFFLKKIGERS